MENIINIEEVEYPYLSQKVKILNTKDEKLFCTIIKE